MDENSRTYLFEKDGVTLKLMAREVYISIKMQQGIATEDEKKEFTDFLTARQAQHIKHICSELGVSQKIMDGLYTSEYKTYMSLLTSTVMFETETISFLAPRAVIYWDYDRFMHIFLRHNEKFKVSMSTKGQGTIFQYSQKDITSLLKLIIKQNKDAIIKKLQAGKDFQENRIYFNGNYYQLRIAANGLIMQFHPMN